MALATIRVEVVAAWPRRHLAVALELPEGATVDVALQAVALDPAMRDGIRGQAVHGVAVAPDTVLRDGDRLELLRPLQADPKDARRRRADGRAGR
jgi:putative ubiquitin-RnfH superfamily antitoxin RatB of RatAB toxin-antitoxin module